MNTPRVETFSAPPASGAAPAVLPVRRGPDQSQQQHMRQGMWTEAAIAMALEGHFYRTDGSDKNAREPVSEAQKRHDREIKAEMVRIRNREVVERTIAQNGIAAASIVAAVAHAHGISTADLTSRVRRRHITHARQHACALMRELTGLSLQDIANAINIVDHSTAHHSIITWRVRAAGYTKEDAVARQMLGVA